MRRQSDGHEAEGARWSRRRRHRSVGAAFAFTFAGTDSKLTKVADFDHQVTGVSVAADGQIFVCFPRWTDDAPISVAELLPSGKLKAYPDEKDKWFARTPRPAYYAVIFTSKRRSNDLDAYRITSERILELAHEVDGFLGMETAQDETGFGLRISYWANEAAILAWKQKSARAAIRGRGRWY